MARGQHHALAHAELHLARRQVGHQHGELAHQLLRLVGRRDPENTLRILPSPRPASGAAAGRSLDRFARDDLRDAQVDLHEIVDGDGGSKPSPPGSSLPLPPPERIGVRALPRLEQRIQLLFLDALHQVL